MKLSKIFLVGLLGLLDVGESMFFDKDGNRIVNDIDLQRMTETQLQNELEVNEYIGFVNHSRNPYPTGNTPYNVQIDYEQNCYVAFQDANKDTYSLINSPTEPEHDFPVYLTHTGPCGACSSLQDLAVYLKRRDLTTPVRRCAMIPVPRAKRQCLRNLGFSEKCVWIWFWNAQRSAMRNSRGGCRKTCIRHLATPNNQPFGSYNPCKPMRRVEGGMYEDDFEASGMSSFTSRGSSASRGRSMMKSLRGKISLVGSRAESKRREERGHCKNTINKEPACHPDQYQPGPYRLNACLQCDECKAGPIFQKISGRQRRNSGIMSAIDRPGVPSIFHFYFSGVKDEL